MGPVQPEVEHLQHEYHRPVQLEYHDKLLADPVMGSVQLEVEPLYVVGLLFHHHDDYKVDKLNLLATPSFAKKVGAPAPSWIHGHFVRALPKKSRGMVLLRGHGLSRLCPHHRHP